MTRTARNLALGFAGGIAVLIGLSIYADVGELGDRLSEFKWSGLAAALGLAVLNYVIRLFRWTLYLRRTEIHVPPLHSALVFFSGFALSVTPGKLGELLKSFLLRATNGVPIAKSAPIVIAERVTDLAALLLVGAVGVFAYGVARTTVIAGVAVLFCGLVVLSWPRLARWFIHRLTRRGKLSRLRGRLLEFYEGLSSLVRPGPLTWATTLGVAAWLAECLGFAIIVSSFPGTEVPVGLATLIYAATTVAGALSFLPGGLLVTEAGMTVLLVEASRGVDEPTAAAATILTRLATLWFAVVLGLIALAILRWIAPESSKALAGPSDEPAKASSS